MIRVVAILLVLAASSSVASAQTAMERAREAFGRAEFAGAIEAYDEAAAGESLTRADLVELLTGRALAKHAARDVAGAEQDLVALLSLEPEAELGDMAPPALQRAFARLRGEVRTPLTIEVEAARIRDGFRVRTAVREDVASLVREVRVSWRTDDGEWAVARGEDARIVAGRRLEYAVEAIGPGGAVLASEGSRDVPLTAEAPRLEPPPAQPAGGGDEIALAIGLSVGAAAVIAAVAIVLAVVLAPSGVQISAPMEMR